MAFWFFRYEIIGNLLCSSACRFLVSRKNIREKGKGNLCSSLREISIVEKAQGFYRQGFCSFKNEMLIVGYTVVENASQMFHLK